MQNIDGYRRLDDDYQPGRKSKNQGVWGQFVLLGSGLISGVHIFLVRDQNVIESGKKVAI